MAESFDDPSRRNPYEEVDYADRARERLMGAANDVIAQIEATTTPDDLQRLIQETAPIFEALAQTALYLSQEIGDVGPFTAAVTHYFHEIGVLHASIIEGARKRLKCVTI